MAPEESRIKLKNYDIRYRRWPNPDKPVFLFLHGYGSILPFHQGLLDSLAGDYEVVAPFMYGAAYPDPVIRQMKVYEELTDAFWDSEAVDKARPVYVGGHSYGATLAIRMANRQSEIKAVVASAPVFNISSRWEHLLHMLQKGFLDLANSRGEGRNLLRRPSIGWHYLLNALPDATRHLQLAPQMASLDLASYPCLQPVQLIYPDQDLFFLLTDSYLDQIRQKIPNLEAHILTGYSHNWILYYEDFAAGLIKPFLNKGAVQS
jgi:pimeloyl-ACP methyl ester carboxylesterase